MPKLHMITKSGAETVLEGNAGLSVMEVIRMSGSDELLALCGGCRSCATCLVFVDPAFADRIPPAAAEELELLEMSEYRRDTSRLACQIVFGDALDGLKVTIAPDE
jgi:2Fe-2S ferredoxin